MFWQIVLLVHAKTKDGNSGDQQYVNESVHMSHQLSDVVILSNESYRLSQIGRNIQTVVIIKVR